MTETLLHYLWQTRQYDPKDLRTTAGERLFVIHPGFLNNDAGPDFLHAKVRIADTLWAGHVELHLRSSDWTAHSHSDDPAYRNVILHVVFQHDADIERPGGFGFLPTLSLAPRISTGLVQLYQQFHIHKKDFACVDHFDKIAPELLSLTIQRMGVERLEEKAHRIAGLWESLEKDWLHTLIVLVGKSLAGPVNAEAAESLCRRLPPKWLLRCRDDLIKLESLILGTAGLLEGPRDQYSEKLATEYQLFGTKYSIRPMSRDLWKYSRMRPENFIDLRLAQLAFWLHANDNVWSKVLSCESWKELKMLFHIRFRHYWTEHFRLGIKTKRHAAGLGETTFGIILVNAVAPLLFFYGKIRGEAPQQDKAIKWLSAIRPEKNRFTRAWDTMGLAAENAFESQGLLHWKRAYCDKRACARCPVGHQIFSRFSSSGDTFGTLHSELES